MSAEPRIESEFEYKGYKCVVMFHPHAHRCGYVGLPEGHRYREKGYNEIDVCCHGGLTYADDHLPNGRKDENYWIGFDCAHPGDGSDFAAARMHYADDADMMNYLRRIEAIEHRLPAFHLFESIKTQAYVEAECRRIVDILVGE